MKRVVKSTMFGVALAGLLAAAPQVMAQNYPTKPIKFIVPVPAGAGPDSDMRHIGAYLGPLLGQPLIFENRPGAGTRIAIEAAVRSPADGYTLLIGTPSLITAEFLYSKLTFDTRRDLVPVSLLSTTSYGLTVGNSVPAKTVREFIELSKTNPAYNAVATLGVGTVPHLSGAWFASLTGADLRFVHYNASGPFNDLLAGQVAGMFEALLPLLGNVRSGSLRVLAISGKNRSNQIPDVPTFAEAGYPAFQPVVWTGVLAPAGVPKPIIDKLSAAMTKVAQMPEVVAYRRDLASDSIGTTSEEFSAFLDGERKKWGTVITSAGIKLE